MGSKSVFRILHRSFCWNRFTHSLQFDEMGRDSGSACPNSFRRLGSSFGFQYFDVVAGGDRRGLWTARSGRHTLFVGSLSLGPRTGLDEWSRMVCFFLCVGDE